MEFKAIARIKYNNEMFCVLVNNSCQKYFIKELEDGSVIYPTEEEYKQLNEIFNKKLELAFLNIGKKYNIEPKVIKKVGHSLALSAVLISSVLLSTSSENIEEYKPISVSTNADSVDKIDSGFERELRNKGYEFHSLVGYEASRLYRVNKAVSENGELEIIECQNFDEFATYINTKANPTYDDVRETLINNDNIKQKYKEILLEGISNLETSLPNLNLTVLNFNFSRLKIEEVTFEQLSQDSDGEQLAGKFDAKAGKMYMVDTGDEASNKFIIAHEAIGHAVSEASVEIENNGKCKKRISISDSIFMMQVKVDDTNKEYFQFFCIGQANEEGKADIIAKYAMGNLKIIAHPYIQQSEQLRIMCETLDLSLEDYISNGGSEILNTKMQENDVGHSLEYILANDIYMDAMRSDTVELVDEDDTFKENILAFFRDYADNKIALGENREKIIKKFSKILANGGDYIRSTFNNETIDYKELEKDVQKEIREI